MTGLHITTVAATVKSNIGDIIFVLHHYGYTGKGNSIICPGQLEWNQCVISDKSTLVGGEQTITDGHTGIKVPFDIVDGLPRLPMRP